MELSEPVVTVGLTWLCIAAYAVLMYYWTVVPQYERNLAT
jgi:hypothetical protein